MIVHDFNYHSSSFSISHIHIYIYICIYICDLYSYFLFGGSKTCHVKTPSQARREARFCPCLVSLRVKQ